MGGAEGADQVGVLRATGRYDVEAVKRGELDGKHANAGCNRGSV